MSKAHRHEEWNTGLIAMKSGTRGSKLVVLGCHKFRRSLLPPVGFDALSDELPVGLAAHLVSCHRGLPLYVVRDRIFSRQNY